MKLGCAPRSKIATTSSGALTLDLALGGGFPKGRIIEIFGPESSGKTTLALHAIAEVQKRGGIACLVDAEHAFDHVYGAGVGINIPELYLCQPESGEMALSAVDQLARSGVVSLVCIDSVAALTPKSEIEGEIGQSQVGAQARLMSMALRRLSTSASQMGCTIIFLNQIRNKIGVLYGNPETTSGGQALKFYSSVRVDVRKKAELKSGDEKTGIHITARIVKNKCAAPYRVAQLDIMFGTGIDVFGSVLDAAESCRVVERRASYYYWENVKIGQGREKTLQWLQENPQEMEKIERATRAAVYDGTSESDSRTEVPEGVDSDEISKEDEAVVANA
ncbi:unnamed protein product [Ostreobium quekettii]|uniref:Uncharacterized protein n=1 Tax=Ostreobium quekettii TaxID=121088 RepID=A0A8S1IYU1_9CHLO|nr:unnamed protein product [Ostreobium quekettii]